MIQKKIKKQIDKVAKNEKEKNKRHKEDKKNSLEDIERECRCLLGRVSDIIDIANYIIKSGISIDRKFFSANCPGIGFIGINSRCKKRIKYIGYSFNPLASHNGNFRKNPGFFVNAKRILLTDMYGDSISRYDSGYMDVLIKFKKEFPDFEWHFYSWVEQNLGVEL